MSKVRVKCASCGHVIDIASETPCPKCNAPLKAGEEGILQLYRMGSPLGVAAGYGLYLDGKPFGHLANKETVRICLPFGTHNLHVTCGATRRCKDLSFTLTPDSPVCYAKAHIKPGFWTNTIIVEAADASDMP